MVEAVVTLPVQPSRIESKLPSKGISYVRLVDTDDAFLRIARKALRKLTVITPFINEDGMDWAIRLFEATPATERLLIVRRGRNLREQLALRGDDLRRLNVRVVDYFLPLDVGYETFHAKIIMADEDVAYVGSANLLGYTRRSMELGVLIDGTVVKPIANLLAAVEEVSFTIDV